MIAIVERISEVAKKFQLTAFVLVPLDEVHCITTSTNSFLKPIMKDKRSLLIPRIHVVY